VGGNYYTAFNSCLYYVHLNDGTGLSTIVAQGNIGSNVGEAKTYSVTANGTLLCFNGEGLTNLIIQTLPLKERYLHFNMLHRTPFYNTIQGTGTANAYASGVTNNGAVSGRITFTVYGCTHALLLNCQFHGSMNGTITITRVPWNI
jgi:hypothetical protein